MFGWDCLYYFSVGGYRDPSAVQMKNTPKLLIIVLSLIFYLI